MPGRKESRKTRRQVRPGSVSSQVHRVKDAREAVDRRKAEVERVREYARENGRGRKGSDGRLLRPVNLVDPMTGGPVLTLNLRGGV